jgi:hypothetical protein
VRERVKAIFAFLEFNYDSFNNKLMVKKSQVAISQATLHPCANRGQMYPAL